MLGPMDFMECSAGLDMHINCIHIYLHAHIYINSHITGQKRERENSGIKSLTLTHSMLTGKKVNIPHLTFI